MNHDKGKTVTKAAVERLHVEDPSSEPRLDRTTQTRIGDQLRAMYNDLVQQPVPDRFRDLLDQLDRDKATEGGA